MGTKEKQAEKQEYQPTMKHIKIEFKGFIEGDEDLLLVFAKILENIGGKVCDFGIFELVDIVVT